MRRFTGVVPWVVSLMLACGSTPRDEGGVSATAATANASDGTLGASEGGGPGTQGGSTADDGSDEGMVKLDVASDSAGDGPGDCTDTGPATDATLTGVVYAPNGEIPVSGALVYAPSQQPEGIPQTVYCAECVELECSTPFTLTDADGSFSLPVPSGTRYLAVQKGQFLRYEEIEVATGQTALDASLTTLPDRNDPNAGLFIPKIAMAWGVWDRLEDGLGKLGLGDTNITNSAEDLVPGTEQFDVYDNSGGGIETEVQATLGQLLGSYALMERYHIIFIPCSDDLYLSALDNPAVVDNIRQWVANGGKWYASDWSNEFVSIPFPQYQSFYEDFEEGTTDLLTDYASAGTVLDDDLLAWLTALPDALKNINPLNPGGGFPTISSLPTIETENNWSGVSSTPPVLVDDGMGGQVDVGHKTWIHGPGDGFNVPDSPQPLTITGEYGCGRIMFTTYHMAEGSASYVGLTPQELVLLYLIMEIGVCQVPYEPPVPQG